MTAVTRRGLAAPSFSMTCGTPPRLGVSTLVWEWAAAAEAAHMARSARIGYSRRPPEQEEPEEQHPCWAPRLAAVGCDRYDAAAHTCMQSSLIAVMAQGLYGGTQVGKIF